MSIGNEGTRSYGGPVSRRGPRVLLFVQNEGDKRPKVRKNFTGWWRCGDESWLESAKDYADSLTDDRWWLVECEDASHGRAVIAGSRTLDDVVADDGSRPFGRILAQGGRR